MLEEVVKVAIVEIELLQDVDDPFPFGALALVDGCDHNVCGDRVVHPVELEGIDAVLEVLFLEESGERHQVREDDPHKIRPRKNAVLYSVPVWSAVVLNAITTDFLQYVSQKTCDDFYSSNARPCPRKDSLEVIPSPLNP